MFASDNSKSSLNEIVFNESNIPIPKRETSKRSKGTNKPPQLQKYIDTIVKASNESNPKIPAGKKNANTEKLSLKRIENESRHETIKQNDCLGNEKTKNKTKEKGEDDSVLSLEIEKYLQKLYPNPYELGKVNEFRNMIAAAAAATKTTKTDEENPAGGLSEENVFITADIEIKEEGCGLQPDPDNCVVSLSFKDSEDDSSSRMSDCSARNVRTIWIENLRRSLDSETASSGESVCENVIEEQTNNQDVCEIDNKKLYQPNELDDLRRIYDMMNKATESFEALSSRSQKASESVKKNNKLVQFLSELNISNATPRKEAKNPSVESLNGQKYKQEERDKNETLKKNRPKSGYKNVLKERNETNQKLESKKNNCRSINVKEDKTKEDKEAGETSQKIDEVLEFMYNCLLKFNEGGNKGEDDQKQTPSTTNTLEEIVGDVDTHIESCVNEVQIVESQNELGGYTEEAVVATSEESRLPRPVLPLSAKMRKRNNDSHEVIKKALETEEKLLASEPGQYVALTKEREVYREYPPSLPELTFLEELQKRSFVICVNSLPRQLRTIKAPAMALTSLSISLSDTNWCVKEANQPRYQLEEICIAQQPSYRVSCHAYKMQEDALLISTPTEVMHVRTSMCFRVIYTTVEEEESLIRRSECSVDIHWAATPEPVHASLEKTLEETEECVFLLEKSSNVQQTPTNDNPEDNDKKRLHELLLRTYNLQTKLHHYLHKMNCDESPLQKMVDSCKDKPDKSETDEKVRDSMVYWFLESSTINQKSREVVNEAKIDHATSYHAQVDDRYCQTGVDDNEDDRSSTYSFKSSNDFSESEFSNKPELSQPPDDNLKNVKFLQKIFNEIELFKNNTTQKTEEEGNETQLVEYGDVKPPAKVLKTVFKGKDSLTELTIGLKDVPMTQVSNISVEKKKYSQNHTKISICISKDQPDTFNIDVRPPLNQLRDNNSESDDDDDFQSVASTISNPKTDSQQPVVIEPKKIPKHRFEFYQKMNVEEKKEPSYAVCRYKALEPLKQALTDMQMKMRNIRRDSYYNSNEYYRRALRLAKMSAGFCQNCGNRAVIPEDTYGCYRSVMPKRYSNHRRNCYFSTTSSSPSFYSFRASGGDVTDRYYDLNASSYFLNSRTRSGGNFEKNSLHDMPVLFGRI